MKTIIFLFLILTLYFNSQTFGQTYDQIGAKTEMTADETLTFSDNVNSGYTQLLTVGFEIETVNTSSFQGDFFIYGGVSTSAWKLISSEENYTFSTAGELSTLVPITISDWNYPYVKAEIQTSSDAQSVNISTYVKSTRLR